MAFNPRPSNVYRASMANPMKTPASISKSTKKQQQSAENDLLMHEDEIIACISELGIPFQLEDIRKPASQKIQLVFEMFVDILMGIRRETVDPILNAASEQLEYPETQKDARTLMAFWRSLITLMVECGIDDFNSNDLIKPDTQRLVRILSYVINFTRFREGKADVIGEHFQKAETAKERIEQLYFENEDLANRIESLNAQRAREKPALKKAEEFNGQLMEHLRSLKNNQSNVTNELDKLRQEKKTLAQTLADRQYLSVVTRQECNAIRPYIVDSPDKFQRMVAEMSSSLASEKASVDAAERQNRALQTSSESFTIAEDDVVTCIKVMEECETDMVKEEENAKKAARHHEILTQKQTEVKDVERRESHLKRQLEKNEERLQRIRQQIDEKHASTRKKMKELEETYAKETAKRTQHMKETEKTKLVIERIEKKMSDLREEVEEEVNAAQVEIAKLSAHVALYIAEMDQCI